MTARERIRQKPAAVRVLLQAYMTKLSLEYPGKTYETLAEEALLWWPGVMGYVRGTLGESSLNTECEDDVAAFLIAGLRTQPVWGAILQGEAA